MDNRISQVWVNIFVRFFGDFFQDWKNPPNLQYFQANSGWRNITNSPNPVIFIWNYLCPTVNGGNPTPPDMYETRRK